MKAERINKNQIRFTLSKADLQARHLKITDLSYGSDKTKALFEDMMHQALVEFGFETSAGKPLMIEAIPTADESLMITVTQVGSHEDLMAMFRSVAEEFPMNGVPAENEPIAPEDEKKETQILYTFSSFDDVLTASRLVAPNTRLRNELYRMEGSDSSYHILLHYTRLTGQIRYVMTLLTEYASTISKDIMWISHIQEHGRMLVRSRALQHLAEIERQE